MAIVTIGSVIPIIAGIILMNNLFVIGLYFLNVSLQLIGAIYVILGFVGITLVYGLWKNLKWIWPITFAVCLVALIFAIVILPLGFGGIVIKLIEIYLLTRKEVKKFFTS
jgi:hypothetical protein